MVDFLERFRLPTFRIQAVRFGFTIIEVLVVIAIVGLLASAVIIAINPSKRIAQANDARRKSDLGSIARALQTYYAEKLFYPDPGSDLQAESTEGDDWIPGLRPDYLKNLPKDPKQAGIVGSLAGIFSGFIGEFANQETTGKLSAKVLGMSQINKGFYAFDLIPGETLQTGQFINNKMNWANLEPSPGVYNFSLIEDKVRPAALAGKRVRLKIEAGDLSPAWLKNPPYSIPEYHVVPPFVPEFDTYYVWHPTYVTELGKFLESLGAYLEGPSFPYRSTLVGVTVPAAPAFAEMITSGWSTSFLDAQDPAPAYTRAAYADAWEKAIDTMASSFPTIPLMINLSETWDEVANPTNGVPPTDWVPKTVGDYAASKYSNIEFGSDSVPVTFASLVPYFQLKAAAGFAIGAQIHYASLKKPEGDGGSVVTPQELCLAFKFAYDMGARAIEVNKNAFIDSTLRPVIADWDPALKETGPVPTCGVSPSPSPSPETSPEPSPGGSPAPSVFKYLYIVTSDLQSFTLWATLENLDDSEIYNSGVAKCPRNPPELTSYNYCVGL